jgi:hypothetical protein
LFEIYFDEQDRAGYRNGAKAVFMLLICLHGRISIGGFNGEVNDLEKYVFIESIVCFPWHFIWLFIILALLAWSGPGDFRRGSGWNK